MPGNSSILKLIFAGFLIDIIADNMPGDSASHSKHTPGIPSDYLKKYYPLALQTQKLYAVPADFTISQGGLESRWDDSELARQANNDFGIKADKGWHGDTYKGYRKYASKQDSFNDHAKFLIENSRYKPAFAYSDPLQFGKAVAAAHYATDPHYADKLAHFISQVQLLKKKLNIS